VPILDARLLLRMAVNYTNSLDLQAVSAPLDINRQFNFADGVGLNAANRIWSDTRTIAASGTDSLDLAGSLSDAFGSTFTLARVKALMVAASPNNSNNVVVGAGSNAWSTWVGGTNPTVTVRPGGMLLVVAPDATGYAVTAGTGDILQIANSGAGSSVTYDVIVMGGAS
jgi:hypothetical protein